ncbi:hypothetical protein [Alkaliphilus hydrothermalis]|uniref:Uncharacterized protein n=1 Tax=Alkaliphilus hydrothermalis TaxID=1482730 RepID=A0ABS2NSD2_9FIRM|nr:hypothetical protein [Alkaliphilus hydrothermalis]MBM7615777.1 hypothetical protein [Alkaliphilus hydrothermalis]
MKKILVSIFAFLFILFSFFSTYAFFQSEATIKTFKQFSSPQYKINKALLDRYYHQDEDIKKSAEKELISIILKGIEYERWQEFVDYIQLQAYKGEVLPTTSEQMIFVLNLSKDVAVVGIYNAVGEDFVYHSKIEGLAPVEKIELIQIDDSPHKSLVIYQALDERFGAFFYEEFLDIYYHVADEFKPVWHSTLYFEEVYKETWIDPDSDDTLWNRIVTETVLDFVPTEPFKINSITSTKKYTTKSKETPSKEDFTKIIFDQSTQDFFYWSPKYNHFILGELTTDVFLSEAALLEDLTTGREILYGIDNKSYKIITSKGELIYLPKNKFKGMFQNKIKE